jgi:D-proline reductase (dithiol) PrdB
MCHQSVGLVQSVIEKAGIPTVSITLLREVTAVVRPPRALFVDRPQGFALGEPHNTVLQKAITTSALAMVSEPVEDLLLREMVEGPITSARGHSDR